MPNARSVAVAGMLAVRAGTPLAAQLPAGRCAPLDTTARWYAKQRQWADDSKHTWSNDSLRTALIHAAGLDTDPNAGAGALLGYEIVGTTPAAPQGDAVTAIGTLLGLAGPAVRRGRPSRWSAGRASAPCGCSRAQIRRSLAAPCTG